MSIKLLITISVFMILLIVLSVPLSRLLQKLIEADSNSKFRLENNILRLHSSALKEMTGFEYTIAILIFNLLGLGLLFLLLILQGVLPFNPENLPNLSWDLALNIAVSFVTNTNWQAYGGEVTLSYFSQMAGLGVQNFLSAATGISVAFGLIRAFTRESSKTIGNAWCDLFRITVYVLLPLSFVLAIFYVSQGILQNFAPYVHLITLEGEQQVLPMGPVASQEAIKLLGSNGGGFFGANSAHPYENPTALSNMVQILTILLIPSALCMAFGRVVGDKRQANTLLWAMFIILILAIFIVVQAELNPPEYFAELGLANQGNMEGKESRFGIIGSAFYAVVATASSCGAVNTMLDSFTPIGGMILLLLVQIGEVIFGGVGSGLYGILLFVILTVFLSALMIGKSPYYLGKKIEIFEMKMAVLAILVSPALVLVGTSIALMTDAGKAGIYNPGSHGFTEVLYAFSSAANNNGSAFAGLNANSTFYNLILAIIMFIGRFGVIIPVLAIAGSLVTKKHQPVGPNTLLTYGSLFTGMLIGTILLIGALTFIPALALGPIAEHLQF